MRVTGAIALALFPLFAFALSARVSSPNTVRHTEEIAGHAVAKAFPSGYPEGTFLFSVPFKILQDTAGLFWLGGPYGLFTYDEKQDRWTDYTNTVGKRSMMAIEAIGQDRQGRLWVERGVPGKFSFKDGSGWRDVSEVLPPKVTLLARPMISGNDGRMWFFALDGLVVLDGSRWMGPFKPPEEAMKTYHRLHLTYADPRRTEQAALEERNRIRDGDEGPPPPPWTYEVESGMQDREGDIWVGTRRGVWRFSERTGEWKVYPMHGLVVGVSLIVEDRYGRIWIADSHSHVALYDRSRDIWNSFDLMFEDAAARALYVDKRGQVMIGAELGLVILNETTKKTTLLPVRLNGNRVSGITAIMEDKQGRIWMGSYEAIFVLKQ